MNALPYLLDRSQPFDENKMKVLDQISANLSSPSQKLSMEALQVWRLLKQDDYFWTNSDKILMIAQNDNSKLYTLIILQDAIKQKWFALGEGQRSHLRNYVVSKVLQLGGYQNMSHSMHGILSKANSILVLIVKYQWNTSWKTFIQDIVQTCYTDPNVCENNLSILKMLSQQIFDYSKNQMTSQQIADLKQQMAKDFVLVFQLCKTILQNVNNVKQSLIKSCLETLSAFLTWIPMYYIIYTDIVDKLTSIIQYEFLRPYAFSCLIEIANLKIQLNNKQEIDKFLYMLKNVTIELHKTIPILTDKNEVKKFKGTVRRRWMTHQMMLRNIANFYSQFFKSQDNWLIFAVEGNPQLIQVCKVSLSYLVFMMKIDDEEEHQIFKICIDFFYQYIGKYLEKVAQNQFTTSNFGNFDNKPTIQSALKQVFMEVMKIIALNMAKPEQVLIIIDEEGMPIRQEAKNTQNAALYQVMKQLASYLVKIDWPEMKKFIISQIQSQQNNQQFSFDTLNSLSWIIGSLCGSILQKEEKNFFITSLRTLLHLCENKKGKQNKAVIASCIMYVVGQYPTFLRNNWTFLRTVIKKLFEFMKQEFPGIMDMACNAFLKIVKSTADQFVIIQPNDKQPFLRQIIRKIPQQTIKMKQDTLKFIFYEAIGYLIGAEREQQAQLQYLNGALGYHLYQFNNIRQAALSNKSVYLQEQAKSKILYFLKLSETLSIGMGKTFALYLENLIQVINQIYLFYSQQIAKLVQKQGKGVLSFMTVKMMRAIKKQVIKIYTKFFQKIGDVSEQQGEYYINTFIIPLGPLLTDFQNCDPDTKQLQFFALFAVVLTKLHRSINPTFLSAIVQMILKSSLYLITKDFSSFPEIRQYFFGFLKALIKYNFVMLFSCDQNQFQTIIQCVIWSFRHELSTHSDLGLQLLEDILTTINTDYQVMNHFYAKYLFKLSMNIVDVLTDGFHKSGIEAQSKILFILIQVSKSDIIKSTISQTQPAGQANSQFLYDQFVNKLVAAFPNTSNTITEDKVRAWFKKDQQAQFREQISDYLVLINRYSPGEISDSKNQKQFNNKPKEV